MRTRDDVLVYQETQSSDKSSKIWDLKYPDPVSALIFEFQATNALVSNEDNFIADVVSKVELVDGSNVLMCLTGHELEAQAFYHLKRAPWIHPSEWLSGNQMSYLPLFFGRKLWDPDYALNLKSYKNPQLKITWDLGAVTAVAASGSFLTGTFKISVIAKLMEGMGMPSKFLSQKEVNAFTMVTSGDRDLIDIERSYPIRMMMLRSYLETYDFREGIDHIKLYCDGKKFVPIDRYSAQLMWEAVSKYGPFEFKHDIQRATGAVIRWILGQDNMPTIRNYTTGQDRIFQHTLEFSGNTTLEIYTDAGAGVSSREYKIATEHGWAPHHTLPIEFGDMDRPETWFPAKEFEEVKLLLSCPSGGGIASVCSVVLEQERPNGE